MANNDSNINRLAPAPMNDSNSTAPIPSHDTPIPCVQFHNHDTILDKYGCSNSPVNPWTSVVGVPVASKEILTLTKTIEFALCSHQVEEDQCIHNKFKRVFICSTCCGFMATFRQSYKSSLSDPFYLLSLPTDHSPGCPVSDLLSSKDDVNLPLFVSFVKSHHSSYGKMPSKQATEDHLTSHGIRNVPQQSVVFPSDSGVPVAVC